MSISQLTNPNQKTTSINVTSIDCTKITVEGKDITTLIDTQAPIFLTNDNKIAVQNASSLQRGTISAAEYTAFSNAASSAWSFQAPMQQSGLNISISPADAATNGYLTKEKFAEFNDKVDTYNQRNIYLKNGTHIQADTDAVNTNFIIDSTPGSKEIVLISTQGVDCVSQNVKPLAVVNSTPIVTLAGSSVGQDFLKRVQASAPQEIVAELFSVQNEESKTNSTFVIRTMDDDLKMSNKLELTPNYNVNLKPLRIYDSTINYSTVLNDTYDTRNEFRITTTNNGAIKLNGQLPVTIVNSGLDDGVLFAEEYDNNPNGIHKRIRIKAASESNAGYISAADYSKIHDTYLSMVETASAPLELKDGALSITQCLSTGQNGYLTSTDYNIFAAKENALTFTGALTRSTNTISVNTVNDSGQNGILTSAQYVSLLNNITDFNDMDLQNTNSITTATVTGQTILDNPVANRGYVFTGLSSVDFRKTSASTNQLNPITVTNNNVIAGSFANSSVGIDFVKEYAEDKDSQPVFGSVGNISFLQDDDGSTASHRFAISTIDDTKGMTERLILNENYCHLNYISYLSLGNSASNYHSRLFAENVIIDSSTEKRLNLRTTDAKTNEHHPRVYVNDTPVASAVISADSLAGALEYKIIDTEVGEQKLSHMQLKQNTASSSTNGALSSTDWSTFNNKENVLTFNTPLSRSSNTISINTANGSTNGYLSSTDWNTFNNKENVLSFTGPLTRSSNTISVNNASSIATGVLTSIDYNIFAGKESSLTFNSPLTRSSNTISVTTADASNTGVVSSSDWVKFNNTYNNTHYLITPETKIEDIVSNVRQNCTLMMNSTNSNIKTQMDSINVFGTNNLLISLSFAGSSTHSEVAFEIVNAGYYCNESGYSQDNFRVTVWPSNNSSGIYMNSSMRNVIKCPANSKALQFMIKVEKLHEATTSNPFAGASLIDPVLSVALRRVNNLTSI